MALTHALSTNNYGESRFIVTSVANVSKGTHTSLATALADAVSGDTIFLRDSVTENVTIPAGVNIVGWGGPGVVVLPSITGKITMTAAGTSTITGVQLITNGDYVIEITGSAASIIYLINCYVLAISTSNMFHSTTSNTGSQIWCLYCRGDFQSGATGTAFIIAHGLIEFEHCSWYNSAGTATASTASNDSGCFFKHSYFSNVITTSGTNQSFTCQSSKFDIAFGGTLTIGGTGVNSLYNCTVDAGTATAISVSVNATLNISSSTISSSNATTITGAGTVIYSGLSMIGTKNVIDTTTRTPRYMQLGASRAEGQPCFLATNVTADTNAWGDASANTVVFDTSIFDQASNYATGTGIFTAPVTGKYLFSCMLSLSNTGGTAAANATMQLVATSRTLSGAATAFITTDPNGFITLISSWIIDMAATDTAKIALNGSTTLGSKTGTIYGAAGTSFTWFSGHLIC